MIPLLIVGDGERDFVTVPPIIEKFIQAPIRTTTSPWARLHDFGGNGYLRQLRFAMKAAKDDRAVGIVAVLDADKNPKGRRLHELDMAREKIRAAEPTFPTAIGEANPHGEAWLLDDTAAVRQVLDLPGDIAITNVRHAKSPKDALEEHILASRHANLPRLEILANIAKALDPTRCPHAKETGFERLGEEVRREIAPLTEKKRKT